MKKQILSTLLITSTLSVLLGGCAKKTDINTPSVTPTSKASETVSKTQSVDETEIATEAPTVAKKLLDQGNPHEITIGEIAENDKAWIKISTSFDPELSMYEVGSVTPGATAIVANFTVSGLEAEATLYWCYMIDTKDETISLWDDSSSADTLSITEDGNYRMVFDAIKALGSPIEQIQSLQIVFPNISEATQTRISVTSCEYLMDEAADLSTGKVD